MAESVINTKSLPDILFRLIPTEKVRVRETDGIIQLMPVEDMVDCTIGLRGMFAAYPDLAVDKFLERKHAEKELER